MRARLEGILLVASCCALLVASAAIRPEVNQETVGRAVVMAARGWQEWPSEAAFPLCEWDPTGQYLLVVPCEEEGGLVFFRNFWGLKRWSATQRREL